jgi:hypothetical protein
MNWYRINAMKEGKDHSYYPYYGSSADSLAELIQKATRGEYVILTNMVYHDRSGEGQFRPWTDWNNREGNTIAINPAYISSIHPLIGDPRKDVQRKKATTAKSTHS